MPVVLVTVAVAGPSPRARGAGPGRWLRLPRQVTIPAAEAAGRLTTKLGTYLRPSVLVVDEVGYQPRNERRPTSSSR